MSFHSPAPLDLLCTNFFIVNHSQTEAIIINSYKQIDLAPIICKFIRLYLGNKCLYFFQTNKIYILTQKRE